MDEISRLEIQLLDVNGEHVAAEWLFGPENGDVLRIGRAVDNDVVVSDSYVSRYHAELRFIAGAWYMLSLGRHGMLCGGVAIEKSHRLRHGVQEFQLSGAGMVLRVSASAASCTDSASRSDLTTMLFAESPMLRFQISIDQEDKSRTVEEITNGDFFQALQSVRRRLIEQEEIRA